MTRCSTYYLDYQDIQKAEKYWIHTSKIYWSSPSSGSVEDFNNVRNVLQTSMQHEEELNDYYYLIYLLPKCSSLNLPITTVLFYRNQALDKVFVLSLHVQQFELVFDKKDFDTLLDYYKWNNVIELISNAESKLSKVYFLSSTEQSKLDKFIAKNLYTGQI